MVDIYISFLLILPIVISGIFMVLCLKMNWLSFLRNPVDLNKEINGKRIFGKNKTWLGFFVMTFVSGFLGLFLWLNNKSLQNVFEFNSIIDAFLGYSLIGFSYSLGELPNSFLKRRLNILPGEIPQNNIKYLIKLVDLVDGVLVAGLVYWIFLRVDINLTVYAVFIGLVIHYLIHTLMIMLKLKDSI